MGAGSTCGWLSLHLLDQIHFQTFKTMLDDQESLWNSKFDKKKWFIYRRSPHESAIFIHSIWKLEHLWVDIDWIWTQSVNVSEDHISSSWWNTNLVLQYWRHAEAFVQSQIHDWLLAAKLCSHWLWSNFLTKHIPSCISNMSMTIYLCLSSSEVGFFVKALKSHLLQINPTTNLHFSPHGNQKF